MPRYFPGSTITVSTEVRDENGDLADAADITMVWKRGLYGTETSETPTHDGTGLYSATFVPEAGGNHYVRWDTGVEGDAIDVADEQIIPVKESAFDDFR